MRVWRAALWVEIAAATIGVAGFARADDLSRPALPTFALAASPTEPSPWTGLYLGTEVVGTVGRNGARGGFGGGGYVGYDREFANDWVVGIQASAGYAPSVFNFAYRGFNYAQVEARVGYDMGRLMPFVTVGGTLARPDGRRLSGLGGTTAALNDLFTSTGDVRGYGIVGAGFAYQLTPNTTIELAVQTYRATN